MLLYLYSILYEYVKSNSIGIYLPIPTYLPTYLTRKVINIVNIMILYIFSHP